MAVACSFAIPSHGFFIYIWESGKKIPSTAMEVNKYIKKTEAVHAWDNLFISKYEE
ncbi:MAG: hypothetical protein AB1796_05080 [Bacillota bacterium]